MRITELSSLVEAVPPKLYGGTECEELVSVGHEVSQFASGDSKTADLGHHPEIGLQYVSRDNLLPLVAVGQGLTLTSEAATVAQMPGVTYRPVSNEILPFSAVWSSRNDNPACRRILSLARTMARSWAESKSSSG
jgi:hypothetical protein